MKKKKAAAKWIQEVLDTLFPTVEIPLLHSDSYTLLIAVILSAQSTDARVNQITPLLFALAATPEEMIKLTVEDIAAIIRPCGLSQRKAKAIWELSKILIEKHQGKVPSTFHALESLPGVGHKTASVVMIQAFGKSAFPVDTHIHRLAKRWNLSLGRTVEETEKDLKKLFSKTSWGKVHLQLIYFARKHCPARGHRIEHCPICQRIERERKNGKSGI